MARRVEAIVGLEVLHWARLSAGLDVTTASRRAGVNPEVLRRWEAGGARPTLKQLRRLGTAYGRPLAVFFLPEPPTEFLPLHDFRHLPDESIVLSPQLRLEMRKAHNRRATALDLHETVEGAPPDFALTGTLSDDPDQFASELRTLLGVDRHIQESWGSSYSALNRWRAAFEDAGILVFQTSGVDVSEARGFSISDLPLPAVAVNSKDPPPARIFTMLHELCHIALRQGGICDLREDRQRPDEDEQVEVFCNRVAGAALVPAEDLLAQDLVGGHSGNWEDPTLRELAGHFGVSREVILRRLLTIGRTTLRFYQATRRLYQQEWQAQQERSKASPHRQSGGPLPHQVAVSSAGPFFVRLVLNNYHQGAISASDVAEYLGLRLKHLPQVERAVLVG